MFTDGERRREKKHHRGRRFCRMLRPAEEQCHRKRVWKGVSVNEGNFVRGVNCAPIVGVQWYIRELGTRRFVIIHKLWCLDSFSCSVPVLASA